MSAPERVVERILSKIDRSDPDVCWIWPAGKYASGYGHVGWRENYAQFGGATHRIVYEALVGPIPEGMDLHHKCHDPNECQPEEASDCPHRPCCNPAHLEPVSRKVNLLAGGTVPARRAAITACPQGHPYDEANTKRDKLGRRSCRTCANKRSRDYYYANQERLKASMREYRKRSNV